jgi:hypothetical protein
LVGKLEAKRPLGRSRHGWEMVLEYLLGWLGGGGGCGVDSPGSGLGLVAGCHECSDEPLGSGATELVICDKNSTQTHTQEYL